MSNTSRICPDASLLVKLAVDEQDSETARQRWGEWKQGGVSFLAPALLIYELTSILRQKVARGILIRDEAEQALSDLLELEVNLIHGRQFHLRALALAIELELPSAYDAQYLSVAEKHDCEFWTADQRLFNAASGRFPLIRLLSFR